MLLNRWVNIFAYTVFQNNLLPHNEIRKMRYGMLAIGNEFIKVLLLLFLFSLLGKLDLFIFSLLLLLSIRIFSGGLHFKSSIHCFIVSMIFFIMTVLILPLVSLPSTSIYWGLALGSLVIIALYSPIPSAYRPISNKKRKWRLKALSIFFTICSIYILFAKVHTLAFFKCGIWTITIQALQLFIARRENK